MLTSSRGLVERVSYVLSKRGNARKKFFSEKNRVSGEAGQPGASENFWAGPPKGAGVATSGYPPLLTPLPGTRFFPEKKIFRAFSGLVETVHNVKEKSVATLLDSIEYMVTKQASPGR